MTELTIAVLVLLIGMISNWLMQRREFRQLARMSKESEERLARELRQLVRMSKESEERLARILQGMTKILDRMAGRPKSRQ